MFGRKKEKNTIDREQLERIEYAQKRMRRKKRFYKHFTAFLILSAMLYVLNVVLNLFPEYNISDQIPWSVLAIIVWFGLLLWQFISLFFFNSFMGKEWEQKQLNKLVGLQEERIAKIKSNLEKEATTIAETQLFQEKQQIKQAPKLTIIVAAAENNAIGKDNKLLWHLRDDLQRFKKLTSGHHIIMGRKTFESFPKPLPNRIHIVITRQQNYQAPEGVIVVNSLEEAINKAVEDTQPFVIGGGEIYKQAMPLATKIELTRVHENFEADAFFPEINETKWNKISEAYHEKDAQNDYAFSFLTYLRK